MKCDEAIAELKQKLSEKDDEIYNQKWRGDEWAKFCNQKDKEIESLKASHYAEMVDAGMRERRLRRALWLARANDARNSYLKWNLFANFESEDKLFTIDEYDETPGVTDFSTLRTYAEWCKVWQNVGRKCLKKAEEYK